MALLQAFISKRRGIFERVKYILLFLFLFSLTLLIWLWRIPFVFRQIYAEDGALLYVDAVTKGFPQDIFEMQTAGYSILIQRLSARIPTLFPIDNLPFTSALTSALVISILAVGVYKYSFSGTNRKVEKLTIAIFFLFVPISFFSAVANISNLYVYMLAASAIYLLGQEETGFDKIFKSLCFFVTAWSIPLSIFLLIIVLYQIYGRYKDTNSLKFRLSEIVLLVGIMSHFTFIALFTMGKRDSYGISPLTKTIYLGLDRGVGSPLVPGWGFVSEDSGMVSFENTIWPQSTSIRAAICMVIVIAVFSIYMKQRRTFSIAEARNIQSVFITVVVYVLLWGTFFSLEPRHMIVISILNLWLVFSCLKMKSVVPKMALTTYLIFVLIVGLNPSQHRSVGPDWQEDLSVARQSCKNQNYLGNVRIPTGPSTPEPWSLTIPCYKIR